MASKYLSSPIYQVRAAVEMMGGEDAVGGEHTDSGVLAERHLDQRLDFPVARQAAPAGKPAR